MSATKRAEELKALEGVRARMSKYNAALRRTSVVEKKEVVVVGALDDQKKDVSNFLSPSKQSKKKAGVPLQVGSISTSMLTTFGNKTKEEKDTEEQQAKNELGILLDKTVPINHRSSNQNVVSSERTSSNSGFNVVENSINQATNSMTTTTVGPTFKSIRFRYLQALEQCKPQSSPQQRLENKETGPIIKPYQAKRWARKAEAEKKDQFVKLRSAWDR
jgi:hypothetical protein